MRGMMSTHSPRLYEIATHIPGPGGEVLRFLLNRQDEKFKKERLALEYHFQLATQVDYQRNNDV